MIYPDFKISELEKDLALKKSVFDSSKQIFLDSAREELRPANLIRNHKGKILTGLLSMFAVGKVFSKLNKKIGPKIKGSALLNVLEAAWFWKVLDLSIGLYKLAGPKAKPSRSA